MRFEDFDDCWLPFLGGQGPAPGFIHTLDAIDKAGLSGSLSERLLVQPDGAISLEAPAWAAEGVKQTCQSSDG